VTGQVATRLWGNQHAYRNLWPEFLEIPWVIPIPAEVAAPLGWNRLTPGSFEATATQPVQITQAAAITGDTIRVSTRRSFPSTEETRSNALSKAASVAATAEALITPPPDAVVPEVPAQLRAPALRTSRAGADRQ
jgi:hypothetical protein